MKVLIGKNCGFCFGVKRAVDTALSLKDKSAYILGELIHNEWVNDSLKSSGIISVDNVDKIPDNSTLIIRTHGEPKETFDRAKEKNLNVIDCTCPFVKDIQKKVHDHYKDGFDIVIIGDENHPEVKGINGWCDNSALITDDYNKINSILSDKICIVVQTTFSECKYRKIIEKIDFSPEKTVDIFKTICYTTTVRQKEAESIAKLCDAVVVFGGKNSNNTNELFEISKNNNQNAFRVFTPQDFEHEKIKNFKKVGFVFGASTPIEQFQEVIDKMQNTEETVVETVETVSEQESVKVVKSDMQKAFDNIKPSKNLFINQIVTAKISSVKPDGITVSVKDIKSDFSISNDELISADKNVGDEIRVMVVAKNPLKFSEKAMEKVLKEEAEIEEIKNGKEFEATVTAINKGGLIGKFGSFEVFVPSSQIRLGFVKDLEKYVGKSLRLKAEKVENHGKRKQIVASQRVILEAEKAIKDAERAEKEAEFFGNIQIGDVVLGTPVRFTSFGAFVEVNGFDCLAHISDLSWIGCKDCSEVLQIGKQFEFKILKIDEESKRVSIGYKQLQPKPWDTVLERYKVGDTVTGKVVRILNFGAFVELEKGIDGLVHVSQISDKWLENPVTALEVGQEITAKILNISPENEKINLSIKALIEESKPVEEKKEVKEENFVEEEMREWKDDDSNGNVSIADLLNK